jgi:chromate transport protein ChrA
MSEPPDGLNDSERAELERLRATVSGGGSAGGGSAEGPRQRWRSPLAVILIVLGCLLAPVAIVAIWSSNEISDTGRYVDNVTPLAGDPTVQAAVADRVTTAVTEQVDVTTIVNQAVSVLEERGLPKAIGAQLAGLSGPLAGGLRDFVHTQATNVVRSDAFEKAWVAGNTEAHKELKAVLSGNGSAMLKVSGDSVSVDLGPIVAMLKQRLVSSGMSVASAIPDVHPTLRLFHSEDLVKAQTGYTWLNRLKWVLPILSLLLIALGVYTARTRRRAVVGAGLGLAIAMLVLGAGLAIGRTVAVNQAAGNGLSPAVVGVVFDTLIRFLRDGLRVVLVAGLVVAIGAFFTGPSGAATATRSALTRGIGRLRASGESAGLRTGPVGSWVSANRTVLRIATVAVAAVVFVFWDRPTGKVVLLLAVLVLVALALIELLAGPGRPSRPSEHAEA